MDLSLLTHWDNWVGIFSITLLLISLNIDNVVFVAITSLKLPQEKRGQALTYSLIGSIVGSLILLSIVGYLVKLTDPVISFLNVKLSIKDLTILAGGIFLLIKSVMEIHEKLEGEDEEVMDVKHKPLWRVLLEIFLLDMVFSLDSVLTAVGMTHYTLVATISVILAIIIVYSFAKQIGKLVIKHPTLKVLALSFMLLIGILLLTESFHHPIPKGYIYFAMIFALFVELINIRVRKKSKPVKLHIPKIKEEE